ncbi:MAG: hypothetical protein JXB49_22290 [Bacteroidales bacterium]|nr:hypothetical protein [Bacteroidales bacterium]
MAFSFGWISTVISHASDIIPKLSEKSKSINIHKKLVIREIRDNMKVFIHAYKNKVHPDIVIDNLSNKALLDAISDNFNFKNIKKGVIKKEHIKDERNKKYLGWSTEKMLNKIDEKIEELRTIKRLNGSLDNVHNTSVPLLLSNLFYRMKLLAEFIME